MVRMKRFYVYENWRAEDKTVVHLACCPYCNSGYGNGRGTLGDINGKWHGPFYYYSAAEKYAHSLGRRNNYSCKACNPEKNRCNGFNCN